MTTERENAEELRLIANSVPALLSYVDAEARYVWCNEGYNHAFGYTTEQIRGKHIREVLGVAGWDAVRPHLTRALSGHWVTLAHDGPGALAAAAALPPQLVLLDIGLPGMDGYTVATRLRAAGHDRAALVAVTGYGRDDDLRRSNAAGFDRHLVKPIDGAALRKLLAEVSDRFGPGPARQSP